MIFVTKISLSDRPPVQNHVYVRVMDRMLCVCVFCTAGRHRVGRQPRSAVNRPRAGSGVNLRPQTPPLSAGTRAAVCLAAAQRTNSGSVPQSRPIVR